MTPSQNLKTMKPPRVETFVLTVHGRRLEVQRIVARMPQAPDLIFLHEGLGSVSLWKDFPARVASATGCSVTVYSRYGSGNSDLLVAPHSVTYMHEEALHALPDLLAQLEIANPILIGHSDGGSIALIFAGANSGGANQADAEIATGDKVASRAIDNRPRGIVVLAPHVFVEDLSVASITEAKAKFETTNLHEKLARHHRDPARTFWGWNNIWLHPDFRRWNIEEYLPRITCPILAIQGLDDEYGTMAQVQAIARQSSGPVEILALLACRHSPHRDQPHATLEAITRFVERIVGNKSEQRSV